MGPGSSPSEVMDQAPRAAAKHQPERTRSNGSCSAGSRSRGSSARPAGGASGAVLGRAVRT
jgi:hypothetical protein